MRMACSPLRLNISPAMYAAYEKRGNIYKNIIHLKIERSKNSCCFSVFRLKKNSVSKLYLLLIARMLTFLQYSTIWKEFVHKKNLKYLTLFKQLIISVIYEGSAFTNVRILFD